jgi:hypothetical protein
VCFAENGPILVRASDPVNREPKNTAHAQQVRCNCVAAIRERQFRCWARRERATGSSAILGSPPQAHEATAFSVAHWQQRTKCLPAHVAPRQRDRYFGGSSDHWERQRWGRPLIHQHLAFVDGRPRAPPRRPEQVRHTAQLAQQSTCYSRFRVPFDQKWMPPRGVRVRVRSAELL